MARRTKYTEEQRTERDAADAQLREQARELLTDPAAVAAMVNQLVTVSRSPKVLCYSLRNQALLTKQAAERDMTLTDVDSFRGWLGRGRCVRKGERGLRIVAPKGTLAEDSEDSEAADTESAEETTTVGEDDEAPRVRFRMVPVFDIAQTDGVEDVEPGEANAADDPAAVLRTTLAEQVERLGYTITETADVHSAEVDEQTHTINLVTGQPVAELARALAILVTRSKGERHQSAARTVRAAAVPGDAGCITPAEPEDTTAPDHVQRVRLPLGDSYGTANVRVWTDWANGRTYYDLTAPRVTGTWTVSVDNAAASDTVCSINVDYGQDDGRSFYNGFHPRLNAPEINGIGITGATHGIRPESVEDLTAWRVNASRPTSPTSSEPAPARTCERMAAVVRAILRHWLARADLDQVRRSCARHEAPSRMREANRQARQLAEQIETLTAEREQHTAMAENFRRVAEDSDQLPPLFVSSTP